MLLCFNSVRKLSSMSALCCWSKNLVVNTASSEYFRICIRVELYNSPCRTFSLNHMRWMESKKWKKKIEYSKFQMGNGCHLWASICYAWEQGRLLIGLPAVCSCGTVWNSDGWPLWHNHTLHSLQYHMVSVLLWLTALQCSHWPLLCCPKLQSLEIITGKWQTWMEQWMPPPWPGWHLVQ